MFACLRVSVSCAHMRVYVCITRLYVSMYLHTARPCMNTYSYVRICICYKYGRIHACNIHTYIHHVFAHVGKYECMYIYIYICVCAMCVLLIYVCLCVYLYRHINMYIHTYIHAHKSYACIQSPTLHIPYKPLPQPIEYPTAYHQANIYSFENEYTSPSNMSTNTMRTST